MKRLFSIVALLLLFVSLFAACTPQAIEGSEKVSPDDKDGSILIGNT